jgi:hemerythrin-like domain-containing protein
MSRPTHLLRHEHRVIEQAMRALAGVCLRLQSGEPVPPATFSQLLDFIWSYADRHHHGREETLLFPALQRSEVASASGSLGFLKGEHETERRLLLRFGENIEAYRAGNAETLRQLIDTANDYREHLIRHIRREDAILFTLAEEVLDDDAKDALSRSLARPGEELGEGGVERYERLAAELERAWSV